MRWHTLMTMTEHAAITFPDGFLWGAAAAASRIATGRTYQRAWSKAITKVSR